MSRDRGWLIHRYDRVPSTMDVAAHHARFGAPDRAAIVAAEQTHGRGRGGRNWHSPPGVSLSCTLLLRPRVGPDRLSTLPLVTGIAVAEAIEQVTGIPAKLKWPNDVWIGADPDRCKVAGILMTSSLARGEVDHVLVGIGINVRGQHDELPPGATSIVAATTAFKSNCVILSASEESRSSASGSAIEARSFVPQDDTVSLSHTGHDLTPSILFEVLLDRFDQLYAEFLTSRGQPSLDAWVDRAALRGELVTIEDAGHRRTGIFVGIDHDGALLLQEPEAAITRIVAGDVTRGPRADSA